MVKPVGLSQGTVVNVSSVVGLITMHLTFHSLCPALPHSHTHISPFPSFAGTYLPLISTLHHPHSTFSLICGSISPPHINSITRIPPFHSFAGAFLPFILYLHCFPPFSSHPYCPFWPCCHTYIQYVHVMATIIYPFTHPYLSFVMLCLDYVICHTHISQNFIWCIDYVIHLFPYMIEKPSV